MQRQRAKLGHGSINYRLSVYHVSVVCVVSAISCVCFRSQNNNFQVSIPNGHTLSNAILYFVLRYNSHCYLLLASKNSPHNTGLYSHVKEMASRLGAYSEPYELCLHRGDRRRDCSLFCSWKCHHVDQFVNHLKWQPNIQDRHICLSFNSNLESCRVPGRGFILNGLLVYFQRTKL